MSMYFEDFYKGYSFDTFNRKVTKDDIITFAKQWDYQPFHLDEELAAQSPFKGLIASGWQTLLIAFALVLDTKKISKSSLGSPGLEDVHWYIPVRPGDVLTCKVTVLSSRLSKKSTKGIVKILVEIFNQEQKLAADFKAIWMLKVRPSDMSTKSI
jgi:acyl dehydratase